MFCFCSWHFVDLLELMPVGLLEDVLVLPEGEVPLAGLLPELDATKDATAGPGNE